MTRGIRQRLDGTDHLDIKADNIKIRFVSNQILLGLHIDENLNWNTHIDNLCKVVSSKISLLRQLAEYVPLQVQKQFYQGYILPLRFYNLGIKIYCQYRKVIKIAEKSSEDITQSRLRYSICLNGQEPDWLSDRSRKNIIKLSLYIRH